MVSQLHLSSVPHWCGQCMQSMVSCANAIDVAVMCLSSDLHCLAGTPLEPVSFAGLYVVLRYARAEFCAVNRLRGMFQCSMLTSCMRAGGGSSWEHFCEPKLPATMPPGTGLPSLEVKRACMPHVVVPQHHIALVSCASSAVLLP